MVRNLGAIVSVDEEADDLLGIEQTTAARMGDVETCIVSIDKDLDCIPGWHFNPGLRRGGVEIKPPRRYLISPNDAIRFFYTQLLVGDPTDNIKGAFGIGKVKAERILEGCVSAWDHYQAVKDYFSCEEELLQNARCLWIRQEEGQTWQPPLDPSSEAQLHSERVETGDEAVASQV